MYIRHHQIIIGLTRGNEGEVFLSFFAGNMRIAFFEFPSMEAFEDAINAMQQWIYQEIIPVPDVFLQAWDNQEVQ